MSDKNNGNRIYLVFSDAELDLIYKHQKEIDVEFSEDEKNFSFVPGEAYFNKPEYVESSPLTDEQKKILSKAFVGKSKLTGKGFLNSITSDEHYFNQPEYLASSPLSENQKEEMSKTEVGETDFENLGNFKFIKK